MSLDFANQIRVLRTGFAMWEYNLESKEDLLKKLGNLEGI